MARAHHLSSVVPAEAQTHAPRHPFRLILRSIAQRCVSKDGAGPVPASWFETTRFARLLTMRMIVEH
jgi:hypothetical protein